MADSTVADLPLASLPARALLTGLHYHLYSIRHAALFDQPEHPGVADTISARLSHLLPIIEKCPSEPFGADAHDALLAFLDADPDGAQLSQLVAYALFSEFMPEAHKNYYRVSATDAGFRLVHRNDAFATAQARDILLSELALVFSLPNVKSLNPAMHEIIARLPNTEWSLVAPLLEEKTKRLLFGLAEPNLVTSAGMERIFGFGYSEFYCIRAALLAYAEFALECSMVLGATSNRDNQGKGISREALEWVSVNHETDWFMTLISDLSRTDAASVERFLAYFSMDFREGRAHHHAGDGLFPPFARFERSLVFAPILVLSTLHVRNAVFAFSIKDRDAFSKHVANELEPVLIAQACELLRRSYSWTLAENINYDGGEIDLVIAGDSGPVLLLEAKGPLPPQGARLTERLAGRIREGIAQIAKFRELPEAEREDVISPAVGRRVAANELRYGLLARSCFGAADAFDELNDIARLTLPILSIVLGEMRSSGEPANIETLLARLRTVEEQYYHDAAPRWEDGTIVLAGSSLTTPVLKFDHDLVDSVRKLGWHHSLIEKA